MALVQRFARLISVETINVLEQLGLKQQDWVDLFNTLCGGLRIELSDDSEDAGGSIETFKSKSQWDAYEKHGTLPSATAAKNKKGKGKAKGKRKR